MKEKHIVGNESKGIFYSELEEYARGKVREYLQDLLEQEVREWLGREKSERKRSVLEQPGYRNGYGKPRRFTMSLGTVEVSRPRVRDLGERFESKILPMFKRQTKEVRGLIPELYLHGLASGILSWRSGNCWGKGHRYRHRLYSGSRRSGRENTSSGGGRRLKRAIGRIFGRTGST